MADDLRQADVIIIGGGPAGLSAAFWCAELGLDAVLLERGPELGGQLLWTYNPITTYPGIKASNGHEMRDKFLDHAEHFPFELHKGVDIETVSIDDREVGLSDGRRFNGSDLVIATGVRRRELGIEGEKEFVGRGILVSGAKDKATVAGKRVVVIGGGDAALENAIMFAEAGAERVVVVHRRPEFSARSEFMTRARELPAIEFKAPATAKALLGDDVVTGVVVEDSSTRATETIAADAVLIRIGVEPNSDFLSGGIDLDSRGYIVVDANCRTSRENVYAVGDVAHPIAQTISSAVGTGAAAAKMIVHSLHKR
jgi:thioredoxin reductase (NADPH)